MKIFSAAQVREWDAYTIANEPISSLHLMERAASVCVEWLTNKFQKPTAYTIFCGTGNNGGDGLAIARMLVHAGQKVDVYILEGEKRSTDFTTNLHKIEPMITSLVFIDNFNFPIISKDHIVIDALYGTGLSRPLSNISARLINYINGECKNIISVDIPSGLYSDADSAGNTIVHAQHTLSFQTPKLTFFQAENNRYTGLIHLLDIGLHQKFYQDTPTLFYTIDENEINNIYKPRNQFLHKYNFGHALLYAGSKNMMGAAALCAKACLRSGAGLVTVMAEENTQPVIQTALPEAITSIETSVEIITQKKSAIGIGPGLVSSKEKKELLQKIISSFTGPIVIDATAIQLLAADLGILRKRISNPVILTPHTGEFEKLFGSTTSDFERIQLTKIKSIELGCYIILKGHHTLIACPDGNAFFNITGNAGMATAGSGDVLTGILTGLLAQRYLQKNACILGVYLHGLAGDIAAEKISQEAMIAGDIIECIGEAYKKIARFTGLKNIV